MAEKYEIDLELKSNFDKVVKDVNDLKKGMQNVQKETEDIGKSAKNAEKGVKSIGEGFKAVGLSLKAMGIGLLLEAFAILKDVFSQNQVVADKFATALGALSKVFNDLVSFLIKNIPDVIDFFKDIFENPQKHIEKLGTLIQENLIERFNSLLKTAGYLGEALGNLFEGKFAAAVESVKKAGKESVDIFTGVNNSVDRAGKAVEDIGNAISKYGKETWNAAEANNELQKSALLAAADQAKLVEKYGIDAEKQRKIRDNDLLSIKERIEANDLLKGILDLQGEAMTKLANKQLEAAQATYELNKSTANKIALTQAETNVLSVKNQVEGLTSEQESNRVALSKELTELKQSEIDATALLALENEKFAASLEEDNLKRLSVEKEILLAEQKSEKERLELKIKNANEGTQARVDAEIELKTRMQEIGNEIKQNEKDKNEQIKADAIKAEEDRNNAIANSKQNLENIIQGIETTGLGRTKAGQAISKALALTQIGIDSAVALSKASTLANAEGVAAQLAFPLVPGIGTIARVLSYTSTALSVASNIVRAKQLLSGGGGGGAAASGGSTAPSPTGSAPQFNVVGATGVNQLAGAISNREQQPIMTYVTANSVTTAQGLDRNIIRSATLG
jgi:hypothetical protein